MDDVRAASGALGWIIAFKFFKSATLAALGGALLATRRSDPIDLLVRLALTIHLPLTSRLFERAFAALADLTITRQTALAIAAFGYSLLMGAEGVALHRRKPWARWFTIGATCSLIPLEVYEIAREPHAGRIGVLAANLAIVAYLLKRRDMFE